MLEQTVARQQTTALMIDCRQTLQDTAGVLKESQREMLLLTLVEKVNRSGAAHGAHPGSAVDDRWRSRTVLKSRGTPLR